AAVGLPLPPAMPPRVRPLPRGSPAAARDRTGTAFGLPLERDPKIMTAPFLVKLPADRRVPLVLDSPHSGTRHPEDFASALPAEQLRASEDRFVDELYESGPSLGATLVAATFPRSYIDPNRSLLDIDASLLEAPWPGPAIPSRKTELGVGLIWRVLDSGEVIYARRLTVDEEKRRIGQHLPPYPRA